jgi:cytoskeleton protein RodZ
MSEALGVPAQPESESTPGALLKRERERRSLSVHQAAEDLHLDPWVIEAIEDNRFHALGAPVYAKGHLRKYATRLELPIENIIERYEALQDRPVAVDPIPLAVAAPLPQPRRSLKKPVFVTLSLLVLAIFAWIAIKLFLEHRMDSAAAQSSTSTLNVVPAPAAAPSDPAVETSPESAANNAPAAVSAPEGNAASPPAAQRLAEPASAQPIHASGEPIQVRLQFSADSWTEIYDAQGARLMFAMGAQGRSRTVAGIPPLQVNLGSVSAVSLEVNGQSVAIPRREGRESARFVIDANGNLR